MPKKKSNKTGATIVQKNGELYQHGASKWKDDYYVEAFLLAKDGASDTAIAKKFGITPVTFDKWKWNKPAFRRALKRGRESVGATATFIDYVYKRLPENMQKLWRKINKVSRKKDAYERTRALLEGRGVRVKQHLFLHALVKYNFNATAACRSLCIPYRQYLKWHDDEGFHELMEHVHEFKKDFFEGALIQQVRQGETSAIIFANRTVNRDRGYGEKSVIEHTGTVEHKHVVSIDQLNLPIAIRAEILKAVREAKAAKARIEYEEQEQRRIAAGPNRTGEIIDTTATRVEEEAA